MCMMSVSAVRGKLNGHLYVIIHVVLPAVISISVCICDRKNLAAFRIMLFTSLLLSVSVER